MHEKIKSIKCTVIIYNKKFKTTVTSKRKQLTKVRFRFLKCNETATQMKMIHDNVRKKI